jgi:hypothetical protein
MSTNDKKKFLQFTTGSPTRWALTRPHHNPEDSRPNKAANISHVLRNIRIAEVSESRRNGSEDPHRAQRNNRLRAPLSLSGHQLVRPLLGGVGQNAMESNAFSLGGCTCASELGNGRDSSIQSLMAQVDERSGWIFSDCEDLNLASLP